MKYLLSLLAVGVWLVLTSGCVSVHRDEPATTTTRTTTVNAPVVPPVSATTTTTTY